MDIEIWSLFVIWCLEFGVFNSNSMMMWDGVEKRRFPRANFVCKIIIYTPQKNTLTTHTENIGAGGLRVIIDKRLKVSSLVDMEIYLEKRLITSKGRVVWVLKKEDFSSRESGAYDTGIEFYQIAPEDREVIRELVETLVSKE